MKSSFIAILGAAVFASAAHGSVTIATGAIGVLNDNLGSMISLGSVGILVADTDGNGLVDPYSTTLTVGNTLGNTGTDLILGVYQAIDLGTNQNGFDLSATIFTYSGAFAQNDSLYMLWFPSISSVGSTVAADVSYGTFRTNDVDAQGNMSWTAPADGNYTLFSLDSALGGNPAVSSADFTASQITAVPEPSIYGLVGVGAIGLILFRARNRRRG